MIPALRQAAFDPTMRGRRLQVYLHLCFRLDVVEYRYIKFAVESRLLGLQRSHFSSDVNHLVGQGYLDAIPDADDQRRNRYRLVYSKFVPPAVPNH
jgi:hypothetical protein